MNNMFVLLSWEWQEKGGTWKETGSANEPYFKNTTQPWIFNSLSPWWTTKIKSVMNSTVWVKNGLCKAAAAAATMLLHNIFFYNCCYKKKALHFCNNASDFSKQEIHTHILLIYGNENISTSYFTTVFNRKPIKTTNCVPSKHTVCFKQHNLQLI